MIGGAFSKVFMEIPFEVLATMPAGVLRGALDISILTGCSQEVSAGALQSCSGGNLIISDPRFGNGILPADRIGRLCFLLVIHGLAFI
jgi:hypothetical protein